MTHLIPRSGVPISFRSKGQPQTRPRPTLCWLSKTTGKDFKSEYERTTPASSQVINTILDKGPLAERELPVPRRRPVHHRRLSGQEERQLRAALKNSYDRRNFAQRPESPRSSDPDRRDTRGSWHWHAKLTAEAAMAWRMTGFTGKAMPQKTSGKAESEPDYVASGITACKLSYLLRHSTPPYPETPKRLRRCFTQSRKSSSPSPKPLQCLSPETLNLVYSLM